MLVPVHATGGFTQDIGLGGLEFVDLSRIETGRRITA